MNEYTLCHMPLSLSHTLFYAYVVVDTIFFFTEVFEKFLREHTIVITERNNNNDENDDDEDMLWEPVGEEEYEHAQRRRRIPAYAQHLQRIVNREYYNDDQRIFLIEVPLQELVDYGEPELAQRASDNTLRYEEVFSQAVDSVLNTLALNNNNNHSNNSNNNNNNNASFLLPDSVEILYQQRLARQQQHQRERQQAQAEAAHNHYAANDGNAADEHQTGGAAAATRNPVTNATEDFPALLLRRYELRILPLLRRGTLPPFDRQYHPNKNNDSDPNKPVGPKAVSLRQVRSHAMGHLVTLQGMIVRTSEVKPCTLVATYSCLACGAEIYQPTPYQREFMPPKACPSDTCQQRGIANTLQLQTRGSKFTKFQELKLQELPSQVPMGHVPRSLTVHCRGELTRQAAPGDVVTMDGIFLPQRLAESGFKALKAGLVSTTYLHAQHMQVHKKSYDDDHDHLLQDDATEDNNMTPAERAKLQAEIDQVANSEDPVGRLSSSLAPEIFGHEDIKRALLLQLVGGVTRVLPDGMRIRGDLNICLMGDPGVAKSQLLKHVASITPRGVYTTGKGSSGVGLTAAVTKDAVTGEMALEGGALVLADRGICCIDELYVCALCRVCVACVCVTCPGSRFCAHLCRPLFLKGDLLVCCGNFVLGIQRQNGRIRSNGHSRSHGTATSFYCQGWHCGYSQCPCGRLGGRQPLVQSIQSQKVLVGKCRPTQFLAQSVRFALSHFGRGQCGSRHGLGPPCDARAPK